MKTCPIKAMRFFFAWLCIYLLFRDSKRSMGRQLLVKWMDRIKRPSLFRVNPRKALQFKVLQGYALRAPESKDLRPMNIGVRIFLIYQ
jgi:hypothetical protein